MPDLYLDFVLIDTTDALDHGFTARDSRQGGQCSIYSGAVIFGETVLPKS